MTEHAIALMDALGIDRAVLSGFDWGARTANVVAALWPERCRGLVSISGYLIGNQETGRLPLAPEAEREWRYQYYFATERRRTGYDRYHHDFAKLIWRTASPARTAHRCRCQLAMESSVLVRPAPCSNHWVADRL